MPKIVSQVDEDPSSEDKIELKQTDSIPLHVDKTMCTFMDGLMWSSRVILFHNFKDRIHSRQRGTIGKIRDDLPKTRQLALEYKPDLPNPWPILEWGLHRYWVDVCRELEPYLLQEETMHIEFEKLMRPDVEIGFACSKYDRDLVSPSGYALFMSEVLTSRTTLVHTYMQTYRTEYRYLRISTGLACDCSDSIHHMYLCASVPKCPKCKNRLDMTPTHRQWCHSS